MSRRESFFGPFHALVRALWGWTILTLKTTSTGFGAEIGAPSGGALFDRLDRMRDSASETLLRTVERFDRLFGDERLHEEADRTRLSVQLGLRADEREGVRLESRLRLHLELPNLERRWLVFVEDAIESDEVTHPAAWRDAVTDSRPAAGLRLAVSRYGRLSANADAGARFGSPFQLFLRGRLTLRKEWEEWERRLTQTAIWYTNYGLVFSSSAQWTMSLPGDRLLRSTTAVEWRETRNGVTPSQTLEFLQAVREKRGHRITLRAEWPETPKCRAAVYTTEYTFRYRLRRDWLRLRA